MVAVIEQKNTTKAARPKAITHLIKNEAELDRFLAEFKKLLELDPPADSPEYDRLELLGLLIHDYESKHYKFDLPDPVDAIEFRIEQLGLKRKDLIPYLGSRSKVSEVLNRKRPLSLKMMRALHEGLGIPLEVLIREPRSSNAIQS